MRIVIRIFGVILLLVLGLGLLSSNSANIGPGGTLGAIGAGARVLDSLLLLVGGVGLIALSFYKRPRPSDTVVAAPQSRATNGATDPRLLQERPVASGASSATGAGRDEDSSLGRTEVDIRGYREMFAVNPRVKVFWNEASAGEVGREESLQVNRQGGGTLKFRSSFRSAAIEVPAGTRVVVQLAWDRISGKLIVHVIP